MPALKDYGPVWEATFQDGSKFEYTGAHPTHTNTETGLVAVAQRRELPVSEASVGTVTFRYPTGDDPAEYWNANKADLAGENAPQAGETRAERLARLRAELAEAEGGDAG